MLTKQDLKQIENIVDSKLDEKLSSKLKGFATKDDLLALEDRMDSKMTNFLTKDDLKYLLTKDEFYESMNQIIGELKAIRESQDILTGKSSDHEERLEGLEEIHPQSTHSMLAKAI